MQEVGDLVGVGVPGRARLGDLCLVAGLRGLQQGDRTEDVLLEQRCQAIAGGAAVVGLDRVADVDLIGQQPRLGGLQVRQAAGEADDRQARPGDVVLPQLAHRVVEGQLARRERMRRRCVTVGADEGFVMGARRMRLVSTGRGHRERRARQRYEHDRRGRDATPPQSFNRVHERFPSGGARAGAADWMAKMEGGDEARDLHALGQQADRVNRLDVLLERAKPDGPAERVGDDEGGQDRRRRSGRPPRVAGTPERHDECEQQPDACGERGASHRFSTRCEGTSPACTPALAAQATSTTLRERVVLTTGEGRPSVLRMPRVCPPVPGVLRRPPTGEPLGGCTSTHRAMGIGPHGLCLEERARWRHGSRTDTDPAVAKRPDPADRGGLSRPRAGARAAASGQARRHRATAA